MSRCKWEQRREIYVNNQIFSSFPLLWQRKEYNSFAPPFSTVKNFTRFCPARKNSPNSTVCILGGFPPRNRTTIKATGGYVPIADGPKGVQQARIRVTNKQHRWTKQQSNIDHNASPSVRSEQYLSLCQPYGNPLAKNQPNTSQMFVNHCTYHISSGTCL